MKAVGPPKEKPLAHCQQQQQGVPEKMMQRTLMQELTRDG